MTGVFQDKPWELHITNGAKPVPGQCRRGLDEVRETKDHEVLAAYASGPKKDLSIPFSTLDESTTNTSVHNLRSPLLNVSGTSIMPFNHKNKHDKNFSHNNTI